MIKAFATAALLTVPAALQAQQQCIPPQQVGDAAVVAAPFLIDSVVSACKAHVPPSAFLNTGAGAFSQRLRAEGAPRAASAVQVLKLVAGKDAPPIDDLAALMAVMGGIAQGMLSKEIPIETCAGLSGVVEALAPLPTENIALLGRSIATAVAAAEEKKAAERTAAADAAAAKGEAGGEPATNRSAAPKICPNG